MNCKFEETAQLILTAAKYVPIEKIAADCAEHKNFFGKPYVSDIVDVCDGVRFEVMSDKDGGTVGNYVTVFFLDDHIHFHDYADNADCIGCACEFIDKLFSLTIELRFTKKGERIVRRSCSFIISGQEKDIGMGVTVFPAGIKNIFRKKERITEIMRFDAEEGRFVAVSFDKIK